MFCNQCGAEVKAGAAGARSRARAGTGAVAGTASGAVARQGLARREAAAAVVGGNNLPWWIAGLSMFVLILVVGLSMVRPGAPAAPTSTAAPAAGGAAGSGVPPDISNMSPIDAATRLFNRVMTAVTAGDSAEAQAFVPMAIAAYQRARPLDHDGLFHLSMLNRTAMNLEAALDNALEILEEDPNHLLGLAAAAEAAIELGEMDEAERHYRRIAEVYDQEVQRNLAEYGDHQQIVNVLAADAERFLDGR